MPSVSGQVLFNSNNPAPTTGTGISGVQVAIIDNTGVGLIITTDASGNFQFDNVPAGAYALIEAYGSPSSGLTPGDFGSAGPITTISPGDPPITAVPSPPAQATDVQSLSPNSITITVAAANLTGQNFVDGPVQDIPITKLDLTQIGSNLITEANNGDWGTVPNGTPPGTAPLASPYPNAVPGFTYVLPSSSTPGDGQYSILNVSNYSTFGGNWYNTADHTSRVETGRYFIAGAAGSAIIFTETIPVNPNTYYVFSGWVMNPVRVLGTIPTQLTIKVTGGGGAVIYQQSLLSIQPQTVLPQWNESSTLFNSGGNSVINFQMLSTGGSGGGNDYIIDDLVIQEANVNTIITSTKFVDKSNAVIGDTLNYTVVLNNTGDSTAQNIVFSDTIPVGTSFDTGTVRINGTPFGGLNPTPPGFTLTSPSVMPSNSTVTITFSVTVTTIPTINPIVNEAKTNYFFQPIVGGATVPQIVLSNDVETRVNQAEIRTTKQRDRAFVALGDIITYTIPIGNFGSTTADNVILKDTIPNGTSLVANSIFLDGNSLGVTTPNPPNGIALGSLGAGSQSILVFQVVVNTVPNPNPIPNSGTATYRYTVDQATPRILTGSTNTNIVTSQFNSAILSSSKVVNKQFANIGDVLTYTIPITNTGNATAFSIVFIDTLPNDVTIVPNSFTQDGVLVSGTSNPPGVTLPNSLPPNRTTTVTFKVTINTIPNPNPIPNSAAAIGTFEVQTEGVRSSTSSTATNTVNTQVNNASLAGIVKSVNKGYATCGDILVYTITVPNTGNTTAFGVIIKDTIPNGTVFVANSVNINGSSTSYTPDSMFIGTIPAGSLGVITFNVKVNC